MLRPVPDPAHRGRDDSAPTASCPLGVCDGSGWILRDDNLAEPCKCRERMIGRALSSGMGTGIPKRFRGVSFERRPVCDLDPFVLRHVRTYTEGIEENLREGRGLWFYGDVGTGKSSLAMLVADGALRQGHSVAIYSVPKLLADLRGTYDDNARESLAELLRRLSSVELLVLDDLGAERQTEWVLEQLYSLVNERWQDKTTILVTSNVASTGEMPSKTLRREIDALRKAGAGGSVGGELAEITGRLEKVAKSLVESGNEPSPRDPVSIIREQLGPRTVSRLIEICGDPIPIMGPDLRLAPGG